ncbi:hypothetical protein MRX96_049767, partial [Rhipicephalus microplus]
ADRRCFETHSWFTTPPEEATFVLRGFLLPLADLLSRLGLLLFLATKHSAAVTVSRHAVGHPAGVRIPRGISRKYVKVGVIVYFVIVPVVSSIAISHLWAVGNADVPFFLPYISDSGGDPPQSAVFGLGLTTAAIAAIVTFSLRYVTVMDISKAKNLPGYILLLNYINFLAGIGIFLGLILVAMNPTGHLRRDGTWVGNGFPHN